MVVALTGFLLATTSEPTAVVTSDTAQMVEQRVERANKFRSEVSALNSCQHVNKLAGNANSSSTNSEDVCSYRAARGRRSRHHRDA